MTQHKKKVKRLQERSTKYHLCEPTRTSQTVLHCLQNILQTNFTCTQAPQAILSN